MTLEQAVAVAPPVRRSSSVRAVPMSRAVSSSPDPSRFAPRLARTSSCAAAPRSPPHSFRRWATPGARHGVNAGVPRTGGVIRRNRKGRQCQPWDDATPARRPRSRKQVKNEQAVLVEAMGGAGEYAAHPHMAFIDGRALQRVANLGEVKAGTFFVDPAPSGSTSARTRAATRSRSLRRPSAMLLTTGNTRVTGLTLEHYSQIGLRIQGANTQVDHNTLEYNGLDGLMCQRREQRPRAEQRRQVERTGRHRQQRRQRRYRGSQRHQQQQHRQLRREPVRGRHQGHADDELRLPRKLGRRQ